MFLFPVATQFYYLKDIKGKSRRLCQEDFVGHLVPKESCSSTCISLAGPIKTKGFQCDHLECIRDPFSQEGTRVWFLSAIIQSDRWAEYLLCLWDGIKGTCQEERECRWSGRQSSVDSLLVSGRGHLTQEVKSQKEQSSERSHSSGVIAT